MATASWKNDPSSNIWNNDLNWEPNEVPQTCAIFKSSAITDINFISQSEAKFNSIEFLEDASSFTFNFSTSKSAALTISGSGVKNNSIKNQNFIVACETTGYEAPQLMFLNSASAGDKGVVYIAGPESKHGKGGGVIRFCDTSVAGTAQFFAWTGAGKPTEPSTVGGEISFGDNSSADNAHFTIYGSLGTDGDTFGNVVFHDHSTASNAIFNNKGGSIPGGDGGNTQFYDNASAENGQFYNLGGTAYGLVNNKEKGANGGDVAFDGQASGKNGYFHNYPSTIDKANGGVTSFNNNPPEVIAEGASAGNGHYINYGANKTSLCGGGHVEFSAKHGSPTAAEATINNYGTQIPTKNKSSAGHTIFSISKPTSYFSTAGNATIWNHAGKVAGAIGGYTAFSIYQGDSLNSENTITDKVPTAGNARILNIGSNIKNAGAGYTTFSDNTDAGTAKIIALSGADGGEGGQINFYDDATADNASIELNGNGTLNIGDHVNDLTIHSLEVNKGIISTQLGNDVIALKINGDFKLNSKIISFSFWKKDAGGFEFNKTYTILKSTTLNSLNEKQFSGNAICGVEPSFNILNNTLQVTFYN